MRVSLIVLVVAVVATAPALLVVTAGSWPAGLAAGLWSLWALAAAGGAAVYCIARRTGRL